MGTFGYESFVGGTIGNIATEAVGGEVITGSVFTISEDGVADSITVALRRLAAGSDNLKCAIYKHSDLSLVGQTEQVLTALTTLFDWYTFNFIAPKPTLDAATEYVLVVWGDYTASRIASSYIVDVANKGHADVETYNGFPSTLVPSHNTRKWSIYCTYTPITPSVPGGAGGGAMMFFRDDVIPRVSEAVVKKAAFLCFDAFIAFLLDED